MAWTAERRARFDATIAAKRVAGVGWSDAQRDAHDRRLAARSPRSALRVERARLERELSGAAAAEREAERDRAVVEVAILRREVDALTARVVALELRPAVVEWRPDHRRILDGGRPVRAQRREAGVRPRPARPKAVA